MKIEFYFHVRSFGNFLKGVLATEEKNSMDFFYE